MLWQRPDPDQQAVLAVEPLLVAAVAPRLDVARDQVLHALHPRDAAGMLDRAHVVAEEPLTATRLDECGPAALIPVR